MHVRRTYRHIIHMWGHVLIQVEDIYCTNYIRIRKLFIKRFVCAVCMCWYKNSQTHMCVSVYIYIYYVFHFIPFKWVKYAYVWPMFVYVRIEDFRWRLSTIYEAPTTIIIYTIYGTHMKKHTQTHTHSMSASRSI